jgi:hypothetical protein
MKYTFGVPLWLMKKYLTDLGGIETEENVLVCDGWQAVVSQGEPARIGSLVCGRLARWCLVCDGWQAVVSQGEPARIGSLVCGRIEVDLTGDEQAVETLLDKLHWKSMRGGG